MLVKFSNPGASHTMQCDSVSVECVVGDMRRVQVFKDGQKIHDALIGKFKDGEPDGGMLYERAYVMENGVTVDTIK